jgi:hypothetical protein
MLVILPTHALNAKASEPLGPHLIQASNHNTHACTLSADTFIAPHCQVSTHHAYLIHSFIAAPHILKTPHTCTAWHARCQLSPLSRLTYSPQLAAICWQPVVADKAQLPTAAAEHPQHVVHWLAWPWQLTQHCLSIQLCHQAANHSRTAKPTPNPSTKLQHTCTAWQARCHLSPLSRRTHST